MAKCPKCNEDIDYVVKTGGCTMIAKTTFNSSENSLVHGTPDLIEDEGIEFDCPKCGRLLSNDPEWIKMFLGDNN